jgi:hypothetical protein
LYEVRYPDRSSPLTVSDRLSTSPPLAVIAAASVVMSASLAAAALVVAGLQVSTF